MANVQNYINTSFYCILHITDFCALWCCAAHHELVFFIRAYVYNSAKGSSSSSVTSFLYLLYIAEFL